MSDLEKLQEVFDPIDIEWRVGSCGITNNKPWATVLAYITNRAIMQRLDEVFGCMGWQNEYKEWHNNSQLCGISVYNKETKEWVTKWDGADNTNIESTKGGLSDSMKRAGYQWGIGRYLYNLESNFAETSLDKKQGWNKAKTKENKWFYWKTPNLPKWALPKLNDNLQLQDWIKKIDNTFSHDRIDKLVDLINKLDVQDRKDRLSQLRNQLKSFASKYVLEKE